MSKKNILTIKTGIQKITETIHDIKIDFYMNGDDVVYIDSKYSLIEVSDGDNSYRVPKYMEQEFYSDSEYVKSFDSEDDTDVCDEFDRKYSRYKT